ncbi:MAG: 16S rRNA (cytosine(1402)-N(4))-methyltransferase RsmH [Alphaproteobacteria bacterium]|uniref:Ribosomal RNA small subunit methyltransferase H n=1 Tax=Candidatus Nitrobium versatile TaxID=2884831 RepID=A0A953M329_9BACT|nr:16S rRNA (cytosine(1402)-N(4))-methyltransferase RsmH [Candidatus Nitrobium versatile]
MNPEPLHVPVLLQEITEMLAVKEDGTYVDATVGLGGHAEAILSRLGPHGRLAGIDRDEDALGRARRRLDDTRVVLKQGSFSEMGELLASLGIREIDGVLFDLGVSMMQLREKERGFSFLSEERLDMRMDRGQELTAWDIANRYPEKDLERILREYGEEPSARRIARALVERRKKRPITTCAELAGVVAAVYGGRGKTHPATRTFQAFRIEVNKELDELRAGLSSALGMMKAGGRLCVISYHSLEDRIVKNFMRDKAREGVIKVLTKKPVTPGPEETRRNPASRSAKLRGAERI